MKSKSHARASDKTQCTFSLPKHLLDRIKSEADKQNRSVSNYIVTLLHGEVASFNSAVVSEDQSDYKTETPKKGKP